MNREKILSQLQSQSTWRLVLLSLITLGIYEAHYIKRQTTILNQCLDEQRQISEAFVHLILFLAYFTVVLMIPYLLLEEGHPIEAISNLLDLVWGILVIIWAFKARNRMNMLLGITSGHPQWFSGLWTFLFPVYYYNFKINKLNESVVQQGASAYS